MNRFKMEGLAQKLMLVLKHGTLRTANSSNWTLDSFWTQVVNDDDALWLQSCIFVLWVSVKAMSAGESDIAAMLSLD